MKKISELEVIQAFQKDAKKLNRNADSVEELVMWLEATKQQASKTAEGKEADCGHCASCGKCGGKMTEGAKYCHACGASA